MLTSSTPTTEHPFSLRFCVLLSSVLLVTHMITQPVIADESEPSEDDIVEMETVVVTAMPESPVAPEVSRLISVPGAGNDPLRALESLPGVVFNHNGGSAPAIRGSSPQENAYYLDFLPR